MCRAVHVSSQIGFGVDPHPTQLARVNIKWTCNRSYVRIEIGSLGQRLSRLDPSGNIRFETKEENREITT